MQPVRILILGTGGMAKNQAEHFAAIPGVTGTGAGRFTPVTGCGGGAGAAGRQGRASSRGRGEVRVGRRAVACPHRSPTVTPAVTPRHRR